MTNLYLLKSDHNREEIGDAIIDLNTVLRIVGFFKKDIYVLKLCQSDSDTIACFKEKDNFINTFKEILAKSGNDESLADEYVLQIPEDKSKKMADILGALKEKLEA